MIRSVLITLSGGAGAQLVGLLALPLLSRLFTPVEFGHYQLFLTILGVLLMLAALRMEFAILHVRPSGLAAAFQVAVIANLGMVALTCLVLAVLAVIGPARLGLDLPFPTWLLPIALLFGGLSQTLSAVLTHQAAFARSARAKVAQSTGYAISGIALGAAHVSGIGLMLADTFGRMTSVAFVARSLLGRSGPLRKRVSGHRLRSIAWRYRSYAFVSAPGGLINMLGTVTTPFMIYMIYGAATAGQYALIDRALSLPVGLVIAAVAQVWTAHLAKALRDGDGSAWRQFKRLTAGMAGLAAIVLPLQLLFAPVLVIWVFGATWAQAGEFARLLAPLHFVALLTGPINMTVLLLKRPGLQIGWETMRLLMIVLTWLVVDHWALPVEAGLITYVVVTAAFALAFLVMSGWLLRSAQVNPVRSSRASPIAGREMLDVAN